ncbi:MAG: hypothetical protein P8L80_06880 [Flavobacteriales bacterium]|jgi:hypothetical protein|nr:hypothetical protein [Flavobacteriales bacterium]
MSSYLSKTLTSKLRESKPIDEVVLKILRASEDVVLCQAMVEGHKRVLHAYGIKNISSFNTDWFGRDDVILIVAMSADGNKMLAGTRLQSGDNPEDFPLYQAVGHMDEGLKPWLSNLLKDGTMELNGMWNSIELAGMGLGVEWMVQSAMASMSILDLRNILALTSPVTRKMRDKMGWSIKDQFGDDGYFKYPNDKLLASIEQFVFPDDLPKSQKDVRVFLEELWADPTGYVMNIKGPKGKLKVRFNISV